MSVTDVIPKRNNDRSARKPRWNVCSFLSASENPFMNDECFVLDVIALGFCGRKPAACETSLLSTGFLFLSIMTIVSLRDSSFNVFRDTDLLDS